MAQEPTSMDDVAALMRDNLPDGVSLADFGRRIGWGRGDSAARARISTLRLDELQRTGLTHQQAENWALAYEAVQKLMPQNPSAAGRAELMRHAANLLAGD